MHGVQSALAITIWGLNYYNIDIELKLKGS